MKPKPIGVMPEWLWEEHRLLALRRAIVRYQNAREPVPTEWLEEYNKLYERIRARGQ